MRRRQNLTRKLQGGNQRKTELAENPQRYLREVRTAYQGLFAVHDNAQNLTVEVIKGKLATLIGKDDAVVKKMAQTFKALCKEA